MKTIVRSLTALLAFALLASCQINFGSTGGVSFKISQSISGASAEDSLGDIARIQVYRNGALVQIGGQPYLEKPIDGETVTIDGLAIGSGYTLVIATANEGGAFRALQWGASPAFEVFAGADSPVPVYLKESGLAVISGDAGIHLAKTVGDTLYLVDVDGFTTYDSTGTETFLLEAASYPEGLGTIRSFGQSFAFAGGPAAPGGTSAGFEPTLLVNTTAGVYRFVEGAEASLTFESLDKDGLTLTPDVSFSNGLGITYTDDQGTAEDTSDDRIFDAIFELYSGSGLTAGGRLRTQVQIDGETEAKDSGWMDLESELDLEEAGLPEPVLTALEEADSVLPSFAATSRYGYISTALGVFIVSRDLVEDLVEQYRLVDEFPNNDDGTPMTSNEYWQHELLGMLNGTETYGTYRFTGDDLTLKAKHNGQSKQIGPVATVARENGTGFVAAGTEIGLFFGSTSTSGHSSDWGLVSATFGLNVDKIDQVLFDGSVYTALHDIKTDAIWVLKGRNVELKLPSMVGLPENLNGLSFHKQNDGLKLVLSGDDAIVTVEVVAETGIVAE